MLLAAFVDAEAATVAGVVAVAFAVELPVVVVETFD